ncbi:MAG: hypothetical protein K6E98_06510 [Lachnospiraceae bacterium]|nr:hypothetical protein [Lachnospiraceae bacterium]
MDKFKGKFIVIVLIILILLSGVVVLSYNEDYSMPIARYTVSDTYLTHMDGPDWIIPLIEKVSTEDGAKVLLLGDSVCRPMLMDIANINGEGSVAPAIAPFTMCGQYVLACKFLEAHPEATDIYLVMVPIGDVSRNFDISYGYQYVVMPLVETGNLKYLDDNTVEELKYVYGEFFMREGIVRRIDNSGLNRKLYLNYIKKYRKNDIEHSNETSVYVSYLKKIKTLCDENDVRFHFLPSPVPDMEGYHEIVEVKAPLLFEETGLSHIFPDYLESVHYYPPEMFSDNVHFGGVYEDQKVYNEVIRQMYGESGLTEYIRLE